MEMDRLSSTLIVILHADIAGSTALVQQDEQLAHERIRDTLRKLVLCSPRLAIISALTYSERRSEMI